MARRNVPRRRTPMAAQSERPLGATVPLLASWGGEDWAVRNVTGTAAIKAYRCPGCDHEVRVGEPHVVTWPLDRGSGERRHWHSVCWAARDRRGPTRR